MPEDDIEETTELVLVAPNGMYVAQVLTTGMQSASITQVHHDGASYPRIGSVSADDFPKMRTAGESYGYAWVTSYQPDIMDWLIEHCRVVEVPDDRNLNEQLLDPWPEEVQGWCQRAELLAYADLRLRDFELAIPAGYKDSTMTTVLDVVVGGRLRDELAEVRDKIDNWRKRNDTTYHDYQGP